MADRSFSGAISPGSPINDTQPPVPLSPQAPTSASDGVFPPHSSHPDASSVAINQSPISISSTLSPISSSTTETPRGTKLKPRSKAGNVFTNDGSFLDRIRRSMKEGEDRRKEEEIHARKLHFADRFKSRGKRQMSPEASKPGGHSTSDVTPESEDDPPLKRRRHSTCDRSRGVGESSSSGHMTAQEKYRNAMESYPTSLKDGGTGLSSNKKDSKPSSASSFSFCKFW